MNEDERAELDRLLPTPARPGLSPDRHRLLRGHLMSEIRETKPERARRGRLGWVALPALAGGLALALVPAGGGDGTTGGPVQAGPSAVRSAAPSAGPQDPVSAAQLLDRIAQVSASRPAATVRDDQYVYVKSQWTGTTSDPKTGKRVPAPLHPRAVWLSVNGSTDGLIEDRVAFGREENPQGRIGLTPAPGPASIIRPTYRYLTTLPTDPQELLTKVYAEGNGKGVDRDQAAFRDIGELISEQLMAPETSAALYRAAALIPGVTMLDDEADALGRHGVAVVRDDGQARLEWIFDRNTYEFLGSRDTRLTDSPQEAKGTVLYDSAVQQRAVVDKPGDLPTG
ncbi:MULTISPECIES: CU044_5270 family protein [unclassified Kitasatospora]|uniref:CU044_5270 family protein n=1 Tax=unclassified Kitasatospora TaxID=2633591 RepID=UPI0033F01860